jgi:hypothetical protein
VGWGLTEGFIGLQFFLLLAAGSYFCYGHWRAKQKLPAAAWLTLFLLPFLFIPTPTHLQYFSALTPFLVLQAVLTIFRAARRGKEENKPAAPRRRFLAAALGGYILIGVLDFNQYAFVGKKVPGIGGGPEHAADWKIKAIQAVAGAIEAGRPPDNRPVLVFWPGYLLETKARIVPKMENQSNVVASSRMSEAHRQKYRIISTDEIAAAIENHEAGVVLIENWIGEPTRSQLLTLLDSGGYLPVRQMGGKTIYR